MKTFKWFALASIATLLLFGFASCAKPPTAEVENAKAAVSKAEQDVNVTRYAPDSLKRAKDTLARMQSELDAKRYDVAKGLALETIQAAEKAIADGKSNMERAKASSADLIKTINASLAEAEKALSAARGVRGIKLDFAALATELTTIKTSIAAAEADSTKGDYKSALEKAQAAQSKIADLTNRISEAVRAASRKK